MAAKSHSLHQIPSSARAQVLKVRLPAAWDGWDDIAPEPSMSPETARASGYKTAQECANKWHWSRGGTKARLTKEYEDGTLDRVRLAGSRAYAYRPKRKEGTKP